MSTAIRETHPLITQEAVSKSRGKRKLSFLLFDEIGKASDALWQLLLRILDRAASTLGDNRRVDPSQTITFMSSNIGSAQLTELLTAGMGFVRPASETTKHLDENIERTAIETARQKSSSEFINRVDKQVVFHPLKRGQLEKVLQIELRKVQCRMSSALNGPFRFRITEQARQFLLKEVTDQPFGARHLHRAIERFVVCPLARLLATRQLQPGEALIIDRHRVKRHLAFAKETEPRVAYQVAPNLSFR
jgi:ATP-dependent Clp protease ATP-binding subunit ClpB